MKEQPPSWHVRPYAPGDAEAVAALYRRVYGRELDLDHYRWKLHTPRSETGVANAWLADDGGTLVGHYGGTPRRFWLQGEVVPARHTSDAMTSPDYRRQGVYSRVGRAAHEAWAAAGEPFLFGLPNDKWGSRVAYLGYQYMFPAVWLRRPLDLARALSRQRRLPRILAPPTRALNRIAQALWNAPLQRAGGRDVQVKEVRETNGRFDELWRRLKGQFEALVVRDDAWIRYRYLEAPGCDYRLLLAQRGPTPAGYLVFRLAGAEAAVSGWIVDLFTAPQDQPARAALTLAALEAMAGAGAESARILLPPAALQFAELRRAGFLRAAGRFGCHVVPLAWVEAPQPFRDPGRWFTMAGDYDII